jgi:AcrR family transcriptional regulator
MENSGKTDTIHWQAFELYSRFGIRSMTMDDISRQLGISKKTLYQHVQDKADLINRVIELDISLAGNLKEIAGGKGSTAIEDLMAINEQILRQSKRLSPTFRYDLRKYYPESYRHWTGKKMGILEELITANIDQGKAEGIYRQELAGKVIADQYISYVSRMEVEDPINNHAELTDEALREIFIYHLHGICNQKGLEYLKQITSMNDEHNSEE